MPEIDPIENSLVLYKTRPARVLAVAEKLEIQLETGKVPRVRPKDIQLLHSGPIYNLKDLDARAGEVEEAWQLLDGSQTELRELADLVYGEFTPGTAWAAWLLVADGLYFSGVPGRITANSREYVREERERRQAVAEREQAWQAFLEGLRNGRCEPRHEAWLTDVESLADGRAMRSRVMRELAWPETPEAAHRLLLKIGRWSETHNPYPYRYGAGLEAPDLPLPELPDEERLDLSHLPAFAIDDHGNQDPDDAVSLEGDRLWVHVADVAALVEPDGELDREARERGSNLYLPERLVPMLPSGVTEALGLGLQERSPALSFGMRLDEAGNIRDLQIVPTWVRVTRLSYEEADARLDQEPLAGLYRRVQAFRDKRRSRGAAFIEMPEVKIRAQEGEVSIRTLPRTRSRELVMESMLMVGEAVAGFAQEHTIPIPYSTQAAAGERDFPRGLAGMYAHRKQLRRSQMKLSPEPHGGLGLEFYTQATSPLRRYLDLVVHQQLRAWLKGRPLLNPEQMLERMARAEEWIGVMRRTERQSNLHWTLVYLRGHRDWSGKGILVDKRGKGGTVIVPDLGLETRVQLVGDPSLDTELDLALNGVDLPSLAVSMRMVQVSAGDRLAE